MTWDDVIIETAEHDLTGPVDRLFTHAAAHFPLWREGSAALDSVVVRRRIAPEVLVQYNPARRRSVHAAVDAAAVAERPCFLCPQSFPAGECGVAWRDLVLLPNPFPIVRRHLTIPSREHRPQQLRGRVHQLVALAHALGDAMCVTYNGARCGASAPDHFHFQAGEADVPALAAAGTGAVTSFGRRYVVFQEPDGERLALRIERALDAWDEDMCNIIVRGNTALFFPRRAHRPRAYFDGSIAVSPAVLEMAGILVVPDEASLERLDAAAARTVYEDVSPTAAEFAAFLARQT